MKKRSTNWKEKKLDEKTEVDDLKAEHSVAQLVDTAADTAADSAATTDQPGSEPTASLATLSRISWRCPPEETPPSCAAQHEDGAESVFAGFDGREVSAQFGVATQQLYKKTVPRHSPMPQASACANPTCAKRAHDWALSHARTADHIRQLHAQFNACVRARDEQTMSLKVANLQKEQETVQLLAELERERQESKQLRCELETLQLKCSVEAECHAGTVKKVEDLLAEQKKRLDAEIAARAELIARSKALQSECNRQRSRAENAERELQRVQQMQPPPPPPQWTMMQFQQVQPMHLQYVSAPVTATFVPMTHAPQMAPMPQFQLLQVPSRPIEHVSTPKTPDSVKSTNSNASASASRKTPVPA